MLVVLLACGNACDDNECDFLERCVGNVHQRCGEGVDQLSGRQIIETPCVSPNGACVEIGKKALCVREPAAACGPGEAPRCEDGLLLSCSRALYADPALDRRYWQAEACDAGCAAADGGAGCRGP